MFKDDIKSSLKLLATILLIVTIATIIAVIVNPAQAETYLEASGYVEWDREMIKDLQRALNDNLKAINKAAGKKYSKLSVDGVLGPTTITYVKWFQKAKGLTVDGICGPKTWAALGLDYTEIVYYAPNLFDEFDRGSSDYAVLLTLDTHKFRVFEIKEDGWELIYSWKAATGNQSKGYFTPIGSHMMTSEGNHKEITGKNGSKKWGADNATRFARNEFGTFFVHSILKWKKNGSWVYDDDSALGRSVTHGCVRLNRDNARWVAENLRNGTAIVVVDHDPLK